MIERDFAERFAAEWVGAWNTHDLDRVLSHYTDDFEMTSPLIASIAGEPSGVLKGKEPVRAYWAKALGIMPDLHFDLLAVLAGVSSITLLCRSARGLSAEVLHLDDSGKVVRGSAHDAPDRPLG